VREGKGKRERRGGEEEGMGQVTPPEQKFWLGLAT